MRRREREEKAINQLIRVARARADEVQARLAGLETAKASAERSIALLVEAVAAEERNAGAGAPAMLDFARYLRGAEEKRRSLEDTRKTLSSQIVALQTDLHDAFAELKKLEHLLEMSERSAAARAQQKEIAEAADIAAMRRRG